MNLTALLMDFGGVLDDFGELVAENEPPLVGVVRRARAAGLRTALVSNTEGTDSVLPWRELFDHVVTSGWAGLAKPDPEIYLLASRLLEVAPGQCVVVDDLAPNIAGAVDAGMVGVRHREVRSTVAELEVLFGAAAIRS